VAHRGSKRDSNSLKTEQVNCGGKRGVAAKRKRGAEFARLELANKIK